MSAGDTDWELNPYNDTAISVTFDASRRTSSAAISGTIVSGTLALPYTAAVPVRYLDSYLSNVWHHLSLLCCASGCLHVDALSTSAFDSLSLSALSQKILGAPIVDHAGAIFRPLEAELFKDPLNISTVSFYPTCQVCCLCLGSASRSLAHTVSQPRVSVS